MHAVLIIVRIVVFLAIVVPVLVWLVRRARDAQAIPSDRAVDHHTHQARAESPVSHQSYGG